jgi:hypothetical protein
MLAAESGGTMSSAVNSMRRKEQEGEKKSKKRNFMSERHIRG